MTSSPEATTPDSSSTATDGARTESAAPAVGEGGGVTAPAVGEGAETQPSVGDGGDAIVPPPVDDGTPATARDAVLDAGTFARVREPRGAARLPLGDGAWHQLAKQYVWVQLIANGIVVLIVLAATLFVTLFLGWTWAWFVGGAILAFMLWGILITPRQARSYGYQLRTDDLVFRRGILWQRVVAVPYGRMQLVDITHGPLDRGFGIAQLKLVTAAASTGVTIPGLTQEAAERLRDTLIEVAETRRTGL